jgi:hypothetical protein
VNTAVNEAVVTITKDYRFGSGSSGEAFRYRIDVSFPNGDRLKGFCSLWPRHKARKMIRKRRIPQVTRYLESEL